MSPNRSPVMVRRAILQARIAAFLNQAPLIRGVQTQPGFSAGSIKGPVRTENQDRVLVAHISSRQHNAFIAVVCDGMGGLERGADAATIAASTFVAELATNQIGPFERELSDAALVTNRAVFEKLKGRGGTTLTAVVIVQSGRPWCVHVGDSRLYQRDRLHGEVRQATQDDTLEAVLSNQDHVNYDDSGRGLLQFVGMGDDLQPHVFEVASHREQLIVLTTDGAHNLEAVTFAKIFKEARNSDDFTKRILLLAEAVGSQDNASVISMIPSRLSPDEPFQMGLSLTLWTPWEKLNIWLPDDFMPTEITEHSPAATEKPKPGKSGKTSTRKGKLKKSSTRTAERTDIGATEDGKPQVQIVFEQDGEPIDKSS
jgi:serine/threonine protein phosphatase PrpC